MFMLRLRLIPAEQRYEIARDRISELEDRLGKEPTTRQGMTIDAIKQLIAQRVDAVLTAHEANQNSGNGSRNKTSGGSGGTAHVARRCTYKEFLNCQPRNFKGTEGAVGLARWFKKMEYIFHINNCATNCQV
ncbi:hypothetical protein Tco_0505438 [Tanacetum coccineum]